MIALSLLLLGGILSIVANPSAPVPLEVDKAGGGPFFDPEIPVRFVSDNVTVTLDSLNFGTNRVSAESQAIWYWPMPPGISNVVVSWQIDAAVHCVTQRFPSTPEDLREFRISISEDRATVIAVLADN